jgi:hypothetical protein
MVNEEQPLIFFIRTIGVMVICSLFLAEVQVPLPGFSKARGFFRQKLRIFKLFPVSIQIISLKNMALM